MKYLVDFHVHSRYSMATSSEGDLPHFWLWSGIKGLNVIATGDFTHPKWFQDIRSGLEPDGKGLFQLKKDLTKPILQQSEDLKLDPSRELRFILATEISSVYKKNGKTRKVHNVVCLDSIEAADRLTKRLAKIGNVTYDGRPMLGLDAKELLSICLEISPECMFIPAHIWTPWFSVLGSKSGFDSIDECFDDLTPEITALETGLSSDPSMNWMVSSLDRFSLVSNSDAHSPQNLGREANIFNTEMSFAAMRNNLRQQGQGFEGTIEFFPEEGKYHNDGHRNCGINVSPDESIRTNNLCPKCGKPLTVGVLHRVFELADRRDGNKPHNAKPYRSIVPLKQLIAHAFGTTPTSKKADQIYFKMISSLGPEFSILMDVGIDDIAKHAGGLMAESVRRVRSGEVQRIPGFDGEFGKIFIFSDPERDALLSQDPLLQEMKLLNKKAKENGKTTGEKVIKKETSGSDNKNIREPDAAQAAIIACPAWPISVLAGPGTGKTFTLTEKAKAVVAQGKKICAATFTKKAADELRFRMAGSDIWSGTLHGIAMEIIRAVDKRPFNILTPAECVSTLRNELQSAAPSTDFDLLSKAKGNLLPKDYPDHPLLISYNNHLQQHGLLDFDDIIIKAWQLLDENEKAEKYVRSKADVLFVDEFQDINKMQYHFIMKFASLLENRLFVIGDEDQSIYGFRGSMPDAFKRLKGDIPSCSEFQLRNNYRSSFMIVLASNNLIGNSEKSESVSSVPGKIYHSVFLTEKAEAVFIAHKISEMIGGRIMSESHEIRRSEQVYGFNDVAILVRTNQQMKMIQECLTIEGLPFRKKGSSFMDEVSIQILVALLKLMVNPDDKPAEERLRILGFADESAGLLSDKGKYLGNVVALIEVLSNSFDPEPLEEVRAIAVETPEANRFLDILLFSHSSEIETSKGHLPAEAISLLTMHAAKGLEFEIVFIPGCEEGIIPIRPEEEDEERRLFYVAITRARQELYLLSSEKRRRSGELIMTKLSRFLSDLDIHMSDIVEPRKKRLNLQPSLFK